MPKNKAYRDRKDAAMLIVVDTLVGKKVRKISDKPFKSTLKVNTVKDIIAHPMQSNRQAFTFIEDDSYVSVDMCEAA